MISIVNNPQEFFALLRDKEDLPITRSMDFVGTLNEAIKNNARINLLWFSELQNDDKEVVGTLNDIYISRSLLNLDAPFLVFDMKVDGQSFLFTTPPITEKTIEYNDLNMNKYYLYDELLDKAKAGARYTVTVYIQ